MKNKIILPDEVQEILYRLSICSFDAYIVGGSVRDSILGKIPSDWDICTSALPDDITKIFSDYTVIPTGLKHGTVSIVIRNQMYEISTFRIDGDYSDKRHPDNVSFTDNLKVDLSRRDFTINAMAYSPSKGLIDPFDGARDIKDKIIRCVGIPDKRFDEDALRMLRAIRFSAQLGFKIENLTWQAIIDRPYLILKISNERIQQELNKILLSDYPEHIKTIHDSGMLYPILPSISRCFGFDQKNPYHVYDVGNHTMQVMHHVPKKLHLKLTALLHDIGKPATFVLDENGIGHFPKHEKVSSELAFKILKTLKYDNATIAKVINLIKHHMKVIPTNKRGMRRLLNQVGGESIYDWLIIKKADNLAQNLELSNDSLLKLKKSRLLLEEIKQDEECFSMKNLAINGNDLKTMGYKQGKIIGEILKDCLNQVIDNEDKNNKEYLVEYINQIKH